MYKFCGVFLGECQTQRIRAGFGRQAVGVVPGFGPVTKIEGGVLDDKMDDGGLQ